MSKIFWIKGEKAKYTGKSEILYGAKAFEYKVLSGPEKGKLKVTYKCPDCGLIFGQDKPANAPCLTCEVPICYDNEVCDKADMNCNTCKHLKPVQF